MGISTWEEGENNPEIRSLFPWQPQGTLKQCWDWTHFPAEPEKDEDPTSHTSSGSSSSFFANIRNPKRRVCKASLGKMILWEFPAQRFWDYCHMGHSRLSKLGCNLGLVYPRVTRTWNIAPELLRTIFLWHAILGEVEVNTSLSLLARFFLWDDCIATSKKQFRSRKRWTLRKRCQIVEKFLNCRKQGFVYLAKTSHCW